MSTTTDKLGKIFDLVSDHMTAASFGGVSVSVDFSDLPECNEISIRACREGETKFHTWTYKLTDNELDLAETFLRSGTPDREYFI